MASVEISAFSIGLVPVRSKEGRVESVTSLCKSRLLNDAAEREVPQDCNNKKQLNNIAIIVYKRAESLKRDPALIFDVCEYKSFMYT
jgi:hypothetical protein